MRHLVIIKTNMSYEEVQEIRERDYPEIEIGESSSFDDIFIDLLKINGHVIRNVTDEEAATLFSFIYNISYQD